MQLSSPYRLRFHLWWYCHVLYKTVVIQMIWFGELLISYGAVFSPAKVMFADGSTPMNLTLACKLAPVLTQKSLIWYLSVS